MPGRTFALRNLVLVVREDVIHGPRVDVEMLAEVFHAHRRTLDVPARSPLPPSRRPGRLARLRRLPEREVADVLLFVLVFGDTLPSLRLRQIDLRELPVIRKRRDLEPDRA